MPNNSNMDETCNGCLTYERYIEDPELHIDCKAHTNTTGCPCQHCLVKMVCENPCDEFNRRLRTTNYRRL